MSKPRSAATQLVYTKRELLDALRDLNATREKLRAVEHSYGRVFAEREDWKKRFDLLLARTGEVK